jgi:hypothetical protein
MFDSDKARDASRAPSFQLVDLPATKADQSALRVYLSAGDLERAFDRPEFRPAAAIVPTNTDLAMTAAQPATQGVLVSRVQKQPDVMRDLEDQIAARQKQSAPKAGAEPGVLRIGVDTFVAQLPRTAATPANANFPKAACLIATEFAKGGAVDRRELYAQDRLRRGERSGRLSCVLRTDPGGLQAGIGGGEDNDRPRQGELQHHPRHAVVEGAASLDVDYGNSKSGEGQNGENDMPTKPPHLRFVVMAVKSSRVPVA